MSTRLLLAALVTLILAAPRSSDAQIFILPPQPPPAASSPQSVTLAGGAVVSTTGCESIPMYQTRDRNETGRDVVHVWGKDLRIPGGLQAGTYYDVLTYPGAKRPQKTRSAPPPEVRRALLFSPLDTVPHVAAQDFPNGFQGAVQHDTVGCVAKTLRAMGYTVDVIQGSANADGSQRAHTGQDALVELYRALRQNKYSVFYVMTHGVAAATDFEMTMGYLYPDEIAAFEKEANNPLEKATMLDEARKSIMARMGLVGAQLKPFWDTIDFGAVQDGRMKLLLRGSFFRLLQDKFGVSFAQTLFFPVVCESGKIDSLRQELAARVFFSWSNSPTTAMAARAGEIIFDLLKDQGRTVRQSWISWNVYIRWWNTWLHQTDPDAQPTSMHVYGPGGAGATEYPLFSAATSNFIFYARNEGQVDAEALTQSIHNLHDCLPAWGRSPPPPPVTFCGSLLGGQRPVAADVDEAAFELGDASVSRPYGRMTLTDD